ncbi:hypothetical protein INT43_008822 [Umbelopsis isabellina]|uniref:Chromatin-remodeling ATPase INO80 n=1 Tax=Mortierella isabellina TaxID=91625 RepID=A0A8H7UJG8_MORIS|nr:hypothetical protein INT43_008822 [Umbelopsis isabellina]
MSFTRRPSDQAPFPPKQEPQQRFQPIAMHSPDQSSSAPRDPFMRRPSDDSYPKSDSLPPLKAKIPPAPYEYKPYATRPEYRSDQPYQPTSPPNTSAFRPSLSPASTGSSWDYSDARMQQIYRDRTFHQSTPRYDAPPHGQPPMREYHREPISPDQPPNQGGYALKPDHSQPAPPIAQTYSNESPWPRPTHHDQEQHGPYSPPGGHNGSSANTAPTAGFVPREKVISPVMSISRLLTDNSDQKESEPAREFVSQPAPRASAFHATGPSTYMPRQFQESERSSAFAPTQPSTAPRQNGINDLLNHGSVSDHSAHSSEASTPSQASATKGKGVHRTTYSYGQQGDFPNVKVEDVNGSQPTNGAWQPTNGRHDHPVVQSWSSLPSEQEVEATAASYRTEDAALTDNIPSTGRARASNGYASHKTAELLSDSEDDEEFMRTHSAHLVKYMIQVHKRRQRVVEDYERKREKRRGKMQEQLARIYQKRFGSRSSMKSISAEDVMTIPIDLLLRSTRGASDIAKKRRKRYEDSIMDRYLDDVEANDGSWLGMDVLANGGQPPQASKSHRRARKGRSSAQRKMEDERRKIWVNIARKDIPRMSKILSRVQATRMGNCKKVAQYCQKEARRAATKSGRANRDVQNKAKKAMKEMLVFWKKNEKEERELRKKAEKEALERIRLEEERREAQRQARKLNFLITQTELYSHFIGKKIKTSAAEEDEETSTDKPADTPGEVGDEDDLDETVGHEELDEVDFDEDDEDKLKEQAKRGAQNALAAQLKRTQAFDEGARKRRKAAETAAATNKSSEMPLNQDDFDSMNFQNPTSMGTGPEVQQPKMLMCQLKNYQLKGLNWLVNLYEQGINGILADEMGLGKTVQSISLMAYLAETNNIWGPFLIIAPASTLHNWQQEVTRFVPGLRVLPYWGNPKDRKTLRQFWTRKQIYGKDAPFHVVITSYQLVVTDVQYFQRVKWQYMVLDEAQAIKSSSSARWKILLGFHCRNRLLLTGTPIQNSMQELWALLHFIMPTLFDSHEEFSEWFSKDIESHAENKGTLNEHQLRRLHMILKPFMLRRIKRNVQHELGEKIEIEVYCDLTARQRALYRGLKEKLSISELLEKATSLNESDSLDSLMNLVMQFRKVCNHPELFERADVHSPFAFCESSRTVSLSKETYLNCPYSTKSVIKFHIPKRLYRNGGILNVIGPESNAGFETKYLDNLLNIWTTDNVHDSLYSQEPDAAFSFLRFADLSASDAVRTARQSIMQRWVSHLAVREKLARRRFYLENSKLYPTAPVHTYASFLISETQTPFNVTNYGEPMFDISHVSEDMTSTFSRFEQMYIPTARSPPASLICSDRSVEAEQRDLMFDKATRAVLFGRIENIPMASKKDSADLATAVTKSNGKGLWPVPISNNGFSYIKVPAMSDLILDSGKLHKLDKLLEQLKAEGHRCLIYFQMTKMIDLMEEYISYKQYKYMRLDGSSKISDRRDMVTDWQTRPEIFLFLLSTRAGGLGINLTAADTVIFYDSDWNPTVDQQAMDRAHRLGQTKQVTVYRLITKGTIEERILMRAKQKDEIQKVVISGGEFKQVDFKPREIVSLLLDDEA